ncbi:MAG TPA: hypothetical protein VM661_02970 [Candidatus Sulfotelmatobacter sp.]|jgi:hypothetical protein|nr:hypothetical protein [Candidatus Sulfotelmatobacter sp.]
MPRFHGRFASPLAALRRCVTAVLVLALFASSAVLPELHSRAFDPPSLQVGAEASVICTLHGQLHLPADNDDQDSERHLCPLCMLCADVAGAALPDAPASPSPLLIAETVSYPALGAFLRIMPTVEKRHARGPPSLV